MKKLNFVYISILIQKNLEQKMKQKVIKEKNLKKK